MARFESLAPAPETIDEEFTPARREELLTHVQQEWALQPTPIRSSRSRWAIAAVAAATTLVVGGFGVHALTGGQTLNVTEPTTVPAQGAAPDEVPLAGPGAAAALGQLVVGPRVDTVTTLNEVAAASAGVPAGRLGTYLHVVTVSEQHGTTEGIPASELPSGGETPALVEIDQSFTVVHDKYVAESGWTWRNDSGSQNFWMLYNPDDTGWIADLPTDPAALDAALRSGTGNHSADERVLDGIGEVLNSEVASPELRSAGIRVLIHLGDNPQSPEVTKEGETATPELVVNEVEIDGTSGYQVTFTDEGSRPGVTQTLVLDARGQLLATSHTSPEFSYTSSTTREWVDELPQDFIDALGTQERPITIDR